MMSEENKTNVKLTNNWASEATVISVHGSLWVVAPRSTMERENGLSLVTGLFV
jgi:hypothetical protein